jgi:hypothetical protein
MKDYNENVYPANDQTQDINISVSMSALQLVDLDEYPDDLQWLAPYILVGEMKV